MYKINKTLTIIIVSTILLVGMISLSGNKEKIDIPFSQNIIDKLNQDFINTPNNIEFIGFLYGDEIIDGYSLLGYKNAITGDIIGDIRTGVEFSEITIHSHPKHDIFTGICLLSPIDRMSFEQVSCVIDRKSVV